MRRMDLRRERVDYQRAAVRDFLNLVLIRL